MIETITADLEKIKRTAFGISVPELRKIEISIRVGNSVVGVNAVYKIQTLKLIPTSIMNN